MTTLEELPLAGARGAVTNGLLLSELRALRGRIDRQMEELRTELTGARLQQSERNATFISREELAGQQERWQAQVDEVRASLGGVLERVALKADVALVGGRLESVAVKLDVLSRQVEEAVRSVPSRSEVMSRELAEARLAGVDQGLAAVQEQMQALRQTERQEVERDRDRQAQIIRALTDLIARNWPALFLGALLLYAWANHIAVLAPGGRP